MQTPIPTSLRVRRPGRVGTILLLAGLVSTGVALPPSALDSAQASAPPDPIVCSTIPLKLASPSSGGGLTTDEGAYDPAISLDGGSASYTSYSSEHVAGDTNGQADIFVYDRDQATNERVSVGTGGGQANRGSFSSSLSGDGRFVAFYSDASSLAGGDPDGAATFYGSDGRVTVSHSSALSIRGALTIEAWLKTTPGTYQIIASKATANGASNNTFDLWLGPDGRPRFLQTSGGVLKQVGATNSAATGGWVHVAVTKSAGGAITHYLNGAVNGTGSVGSSLSDANSKPVSIGNRDDLTYNFYGRLDDVALYASALSSSRIAAHHAARTTGYKSTVLADAPVGYWRLGDDPVSSVATDTSPNARHGSYQGSQAHDEFGALTVDLNEATDVFVRDRQSGTTERASLTSNGQEVPSSDGSFGPVLSADGRYVAFYTDDSLDPADTNGNTDVYVRDRQTSTIERVSLTTSGAQIPGASYFQAMSSDARFVVFNTYSAAYDPAKDTNNDLDVYIRDRLAGTTTLVSTNTSASAAGNGASYFPTVSADGTRVAFYSFASNLVSGDSNGVNDVFVRDLSAAQTTRVSQRASGVQTVSAGWYPSLSADGGYVAYYSADPQIVGADSNGVEDVFVRDLEQSTTSRASVATDGREANGVSKTFSPGVISADGRFVAFVSSADNLLDAGADSNGLQGVFIHDRGRSRPKTSTVSSISGCLVSTTRHSSTATSRIPATRQRSSPKGSTTLPRTRRAIS